MKTTPDFTLLQCREALADFDQDAVEQAIHVATSNDAELIQRTALNPEMGRILFWVKEWMTVERIETKSAAITRLRYFPAIRRERKQARNYFHRLNAVLGLSL